MDSSGGVATVLVEHEDIFIDLVQRFPARRYPIIFAEDFPRALAHLRAHRALVLLFPLRDGLDLTVLREVLDEAHDRGTQTIGLGAKPATWPEDLAALVDETVSGDDVAAVLDVVARRLEEQRSLPRVAIEVPLTIAGKGGFKATVISARSLYVPSDQTLTTGQMVQFSIDTGAATLRGWASVQRPTAPAQAGPAVVLTLGQREVESRAYLDGLVRGALLIEQAELARDVPDAKLPEAVAQRLIQRIEQDVAGLRARLELQNSVTDALGGRLEAFVESEQWTARWEGLRTMLKQKFGAQRDLFHRLIARVDDLATKQAEADALRDALAMQATMQEQLEQQNALVEELRSTVDRQAAMLDGLQQQLDRVAEAAPGASDADRAREPSAVLSQPPATEAKAPAPPADEGRTTVPDPFAAVHLGEWAPIPELPGAPLDLEEGDLCVAAFGQEVTAVDPPSAEDLEVERSMRAAIGAPPDGLAVSPSAAAVAEVPGGPPSLPPPPVDEGVGEPDPIAPLSASEAIAALEATPNQALLRQRRLFVVGAAALVVMVLVGVVAWLLLRGSRSEVQAVAIAADESRSGAVADENEPPVPVAERLVADASPVVDSEAPAISEPEEVRSGDEAEPVVDAGTPLSAPRQRRTPTAAQRRRRDIVTAIRLERRGAHAASRRYLTRALRRGDDDVVRAWLARTHTAQGQLWPAIHHMTRAVAEAPKSRKPRRLDQLGLLYLKVGKSTLACQSLAKALRLAPGNTRIKAHVAQHCRR